MKSKSFLLLFNFLLIFLLKSNILSAQDTITFNGNRTFIVDSLHFIIDKQHKLDFNNIISGNLAGEKKEKSSLNFGNDNASIWSQFYIYNNTNDEKVSIQVENPMLDTLELYTSSNPESKIGIYNTVRFGERANDIAIPTFEFTVAPHTYQFVTLHVASTEEQFVPIIIDNGEEAISQAFLREIAYAIFAGVILVMIFYNLFVYFSTKDLSYLYYVFFVLFIGASQLTLGGFTYKYILHGHPHVNKYSIVVFPAIAGILAILFLNNFLRVDLYYPKIKKFMYAIMICYGITGLLRLFNFYQLSSKATDVVGILGSVVVYVTGITIYKKGFRPAIYFLVAWSVFVIGLMLYVFRNFGILPYSNITNYTMPIGTAIEIGLLSFALADKINTLQKEKREKEQEVIRSLQENERLVREQNVILEEKVSQRTHDLNTANIQLNTALTDLKEAQTQLVENAKMASLGQLTAGIAHEINNPINFVKSNINPLRLDIKDVFEVLDEYNNLHTADLQNGNAKHKLDDIQNLQEELDISFIKTEITNLLKGIEEGAERTAEIVQGLRIFSRLDESTFKKADVHDGIASTLLLLKNSIPYYIDVNQSFEADGVIECSPGEINQVFMNIINNAVQAITGKDEKAEKECIDITTQTSGEEILIKIKDSGIGMKEEVKERIFEPFFTTKDVGEGTGLGLSIVFKIIQKHGGKIVINSHYGSGSEFVLHLPISQKN